MNYSPQDSHLPPLSNIEYLLGDHPTVCHRLTADEGATKLFLDGMAGDSSDNLRVVGLELDLLRELGATLWATFGGGPRVRGSLAAFVAELSRRGWTEEERVVALPDVRSARFCFRSHDRVAHRFLINEVLMPRRYSLGVSTRGLLRLYALLLDVVPAPGFLYRGVFLRLRRS